MRGINVRKEVKDSKFCLKMLKYETESYGCFKGIVYLLYLFWDEQRFEMSLSRIIGISENEVIDKLRVDNLVIELC